MDPDLSAFEIAVLTAFYRPSPQSFGVISGPDKRDARKAAIERLVELGLLREVEPFAFQATHEGHTLLDRRWQADKKS